MASIERPYEADDAGARPDVEVYIQRCDTPNLSAPPPPEEALTRPVWVDALFILVVAASAILLGRAGWFG